MINTQILKFIRKKKRNKREKEKGKGKEKEKEKKEFTCMFFLSPDVLLLLLFFSVQLVP